MYMLVYLIADRTANDHRSPVICTKVMCEGPMNVMDENILSASISPDHLRDAFGLLQEIQIISSNYFWVIVGWPNT